MNPVPVNPYPDMELPNDMDEVTKQLEEELRKENGDRPDWLMHLAFRMAHERLQDQEDTLQEINDKLDGLDQKMDDHQQKNVVTWKGLGKALAGTGTVVAGVAALFALVL